VELLRIPNPKYTEAQAAGRSTWGIKEYITNFTAMPDDGLLIPRGLRSWLFEQCDVQGIKYKIVDKRTKFDHIGIDSSRINYRPYQSRAVIDLVSKAPEGVLVAPAGSGKTVMGLSLIPLVGQPTIWLTHTGPLATQARERAEAFLPDIGDIGLIGKGRWDVGKVLTIAMIQTLMRNLDQLYELKNKFGLAVLDEAHHAPARTFLDVVGLLASYYIYGLTATPYRRDRLETLMFQTLGLDTTTVPVEEVDAHGGIIVPTIKVRNLKLKKMSRMNASIQEILKYDIVLNNARNQIIINDVLEEAQKGRFCIVISDRRKHCKHLYDELSKYWTKVGIATGEYSKKHIKEEIDRFNNKEITILVATFSLLGEGFDVPFLDRAFISMPFRAEAKAEQLIGRIQRSYPGKKDAVVYDYVDINVGMLKNQFSSKYNDCRLRTYRRLGAEIRNS
jgi:superfamily II DNA or RNA helicase